jgi:hypothetical protein
MARLAPPILTRHSPAPALVTWMLRRVIVLVP